MYIHAHIYPRVIRENGHMVALSQRLSQDYYSEITVIRFHKIVIGTENFSHLKTAILKVKAQLEWLGSALPRLKILSSNFINSSSYISNKQQQRIPHRTRYRFFYWFWYIKNQVEQLIFSIKPNGPNPLYKDEIENIKPLIIFL